MVSELHINIGMPQKDNQVCGGNFSRRQDAAVPGGAASCAANSGDGIAWRPRDHFEVYQVLEVGGVIPKVSPTGSSSSEFDVFALSRYASRDISCVTCRACDIARATDQ